MKIVSLVGKGGVSLKAERTPLARGEELKPFKRNYDELEKKVTRPNLRTAREGVGGVR